MVQDLRAASFEQFLKQNFQKVFVKIRTIFFHQISFVIQMPLIESHLTCIHHECWGL